RVRLRLPGRAGRGLQHPAGLPAATGGQGPRVLEGVARAVGGTGGVITSCGLVMACTFFVGLARNPVFLVQEIGVAVVIGVLLDTFLIRPVLVPALAVLLGTVRRWTPAGSTVPEPAYDPAN
ncbi:MAG: MMPL family transporter, partial [Candidatus Dormibacteraeota bacterium]|nr:MMPL family transporter [Candidatus Dormibacteraeota bacterium]